jgi:hypothetical protein
LPDEAESDEGEQFLGRTDGVHHQAGRRRNPVAEICCEARISKATHFNWKKKYADLLPTEMKRLKQLEDENARLKKIVALTLYESRGPRHCPRAD